MSREPGRYFPPRVVADPDGGFYFTWAGKTDAGYAIFGRAYRIERDENGEGYGERAGTLLKQERVSEAGGVASEPAVVCM